MALSFCTALDANIFNRFPKFLCSALFVFRASRLIFLFNFINLLVSSDIKKSITFTLLFGQDLSNAVLIMLAILFTVASISAGVTASVSIKFLSIILF